MIKVLKVTTNLQPYTPKNNPKMTKYTFNNTTRSFSGRRKWFQMEKLKEMTCMTKTANMLLHINKY
jgi:hypothetical protein